MRSDADAGDKGSRFSVFLSKPAIRKPRPIDRVAYRLLIFIKHAY